MDKNIKCFKTLNGEFIVTEIADVTDDGMYVLSYPSIVTPVPHQQGQIGFGKYMLFSDYKKEILMNPINIAVESEPNEQILNTYIQWATQMKAQDSGIVVTNQMPQGQVPSDGSKADFSRLNM